jgi:diguanylate cyclase (GGDEF)-like protein
VFICLSVPTVFVGTASWPLRIAAGIGLLGACVWEGVALRLRRFPVWADVLETVAVGVVAWRYPTGNGGLVIVLAFALLALGFRTIYSTSLQAVLRTVVLVGAIYVGWDQHPAGLSRRVPVVVLAAALALLGMWASRLAALRAAAAHFRAVVNQLSEDLGKARGRADIHAAMLRAVLELVRNRTGARVIIWDQPDSLRPTAAAGVNVDQVRTDAGRSLTDVPWIRDALLAGKSVYREAFDADEVRPVLGFDPFRHVVFVVPLQHREQVRAMTVAVGEPIPRGIRADIEHVARAGEVALGSIELTREGLQGLRERSYPDPGTAITNRDVLRQRLEQALEQPGRLVAVLVIRIDRFRVIGDSLGSVAGGDPLAILNTRLEDSVPAGCTIARFGGDDFAVLLDDVADRAAAEQVAARIRAALDEPLPGVLGSGAGVFVHSSVGVAVSGPDSRSAADLLRNADIAVHVAEVAGGGSHRLFDPAMRASIVGRLELESDLARAADSQEFELHYQPVVQLRDWDTASGVEALIRWNHPGRGMVPPGDFISVAEETGLITDIGEWVMRESCRQQHNWTATGSDLARMTVSVNLSPVQFAQQDVADMIGAAIAETGADPARMIIELTESALIESSQSNRDKLYAIKDTGVRLALDDFGTGFSSLSYLRQFPFDIIKIDRSFVTEADVDQAAAALASSVIAIGKTLNRTIVAEGVETIGQAEWLTRAGCDAAQGFFFARPMRPEHLLPLLTNGLSARAARP